MEIQEESWGVMFYYEKANYKNCNISTPPPSRALVGWNESLCSGPSTHNAFEVNWKQSHLPSYFLASVCFQWTCPSFVSGEEQNRFLSKYSRWMLVPTASTHCQLVNSKKKKSLLSAERRWVTFPNSYGIVYLFSLKWGLLNCSV